MKIVLDTNCLVKIIAGKGNEKKVWNDFLQGRYTLCYSTEIMLEYEEVLKRIFNDTEMVEAALNIIITRENVEMISPAIHYRLIEADPDDNKFVDCAVACNATYIVSDDHHYNILKQIPFPAVAVKKLQEFIQILKAAPKTKKR